MLNVKPKVMAIHTCWGPGTGHSTMTNNVDYVLKSEHDQIARENQARIRELETQLACSGSARIAMLSAHVEKLEAAHASCKTFNTQLATAALAKDRRIEKLEAALKAAEWGFNHKRCVVCAGWTGDSESDFFHAPSCIVGKALATAPETAACE